MEFNHTHYCDSNKVHSLCIRLQLIPPRNKLQLLQFHFVAVVKVKPSNTY